MVNNVVRNEVFSRRRPSLANGHSNNHTSCIVSVFSSANSKKYTLRVNMVNTKIHILIIYLGRSLRSTEHNILLHVSKSFYNTTEFPIRTSQQRMYSFFSEATLIIEILGPSPHEYD